MPSPAPSAGGSPAHFSLFQVNSETRAFLPPCGRPGLFKEVTNSMEELYINMALSVLLTAIKNPNKKATLKKALLKLRNAINTLYAGDPDFQ